MSDEIHDAAVERQLKEDARRRAGTDPLPGPLADAFQSDCIPVNGSVKVRRVVTSDWVILRQLKSPIIQQMLEMQKDEAIREEVPFTDEEGYEICWQFTHNPKDCRALLEVSRERFRQQAIEDIADSLDPSIVGQVVKAVGKQILRSFETALKYGTDESDGEKKSPLTTTKTTT